MKGPRDLWHGLGPKHPPAELRQRVLVAARDASIRPEPALWEALYRDRLLRFCVAGLFVLAIANALLAGGGSQPPVVRPMAFAGDGAVPGDSGLTAAEQWDDLAPVLGEVVTRSRG